MTKKDDMHPPERSSETEQTRRQAPKTGRSLKSIPGLPVRSRLGRSKLSIWLLAICIAVALILRGTTTAEPQVRGHDWLPDVLELPEDVEILADRQIGSTIRMLTLMTSTDVDDLSVTWENALRENGYAIRRGREQALYGVIEFNGTGIVNIKIIAAPGIDSEHSVIKIDATLR